MRVRVARVSAAAVVVAVGVLMTACAAPTSGRNPPAGYKTPANAMAGFVGNLLGNRPQAACRYVVPSQAGLCALGLVAAGNASGHWHIGDTATSGNRAVVDVEYLNACMVGACITNRNPRAGLPGSGLSFSAAFAQARQAKGYTLACLRVGGDWYVDLVEGP